MQLPEIDQSMWHLSICLFIVQLCSFCSCSYLPLTAVKSQAQRKKMNIPEYFYPVPMRRAPLPVPVRAQCNVFGKFMDTQDTIHDTKQQKTLVVDSVLLRVE